MTTTAIAAEITADQVATGFANGTAWTVARYGTLVITEFGGATDDIQCAHEPAAIEEFNDMVDSLTEE